MESRPPVEVHVLAGVDEIEAGDPDGQREPEDEGGGGGHPAHGDPASPGRDAVREAEDPVAHPREALGVGVADQEERREGGEPEAERVEHPRGEREERAGEDGGQQHVPGRQESDRQVARRRARIARVDEAVRQAVDAHREGARSRHGERHPDDHAPSRPAVRRQDHRHVGEWQGEDGVLELDRVQEVAKRAGHYRPYSCQRFVTSERISSLITISSGHGWPMPSSEVFSVASMPILPPNRWRSAAWSRSSIGPSTMTMSRLASTLPVARQATSERFWTSTCSETTRMFLASIMSPSPQSAYMTFRAWPG